MTEQQEIQEPVSGQKPDSVLWQKMLKGVFSLCLLLLIIAALAQTSGRLIIPMISYQKSSIEEQLGALLGTRVSVSEVNGSWFRYGPVLEVNELQITTPDNSAVAPHVISALSIKPAISRSLLSRSLVIEEIIISEPSFVFRQNDNGSWTLDGLESGSVDYTDAIIDFLLNTGRMQIIEADLILHWADGRNLVLDNVYMDLSNDEAQHLSQIQARIAGQQSPFQLQIELTGDPRQQFIGSAHLRTNGLDISEFINSPQVDLESAQFSGDLWLTLDKGEQELSYSLQSNLESLNLLGTGSEGSQINILSLNISDMDMALNHEAAQRWQVWLGGAELDWLNRPWSSGDIYFDYQDQGEKKPLEIFASSIDLAMVNDVVDDLLLLPEKAALALGDLSPEGELLNVKVSTDLGGEFAGGFLLKANLQDVAVGAWQGAPSGKGIQGFVQADNKHGFVELDSSAFEIHLPRLFEESWSYDSANSRVHWQLQEDGIRVNSNVIDVRNDFVHGHVQFDLLNSLDSSGEPQSELTLLIGLLEMDASYKSLYLPTLPNVKGTMDWLKEALLEGDISNSGFVSRTVISRIPKENSGTVLSFYSVDNGELKFQPQWPALTDISAFVVVNNNEVDVEAEHAMIQQMALATTRAEVRPDPEGGSWISLQSSADTSTALGLDFLKTTPVRNNIGSFIDDWEGQGSLHVDINLGIPINNPARETDVLVNVLSNLSTLSIPDYSLSIDELRGRVIYNSENGLSASALSGQLFDFPIAATIEPMITPMTDGRSEISGTRIVGSGRASKSALQAWQGQPDFVKNVLNFASGEIDYLAEITIPNASQTISGNDNNRIRLASELLGLSLDLPHPFNKTVENIRPLEVLIEFTENNDWVSVRFDNRVGANLRITENDFTGGKVVFGPEARQMRFGEVPLVESGLVFNGFLDRFDYDDWESSALRFSEMSLTPGIEQDTLADYISLVDIDAGRLLVVGQELENVHTQVSRSGGIEEDSESGFGIGDSSWLVHLENELLSGSFMFPDNELSPWTINLDYLRFPVDDEEIEVELEDEVDILAEINPATLPDLDFRTSEFSLGDKHFGAWEFVLRSLGDSASISELKMTTPDAQIRDFSGDTGANLDWRYDNGIHTSSFNGLFSAGDLAQVLPGWGYDANVESESAIFISNLQWSGSPVAFALEKVVGDVQVDIRNGRFVDIDSGGSRLFGAFSFDSLVRRLQLDFSDLYEKGLAYDAIGGSLYFDQGIVATDGPFEISGPSSKINIEGRLNLLNETIDADMLVNVPFSQNLSVLAGILGAWPIALSTFLASRIFEDQMDEFTTVLYRLEGPWENPASGFEPAAELLEASSSAIMQDTESSASAGNTASEE